MAATVTIRRWTGTAGSPTKTDITGINTRVNQNDTHSTAGTSNPVPIPTSSTNYSYWASTRLSCDGAPSGTIDNLRWFSDAVSFGTGVTVSGADASTGSDSGYRQATSAIQLNTTNHTGLDAAQVDVTTLTSASPRSLGGSTTGTGDFGDYFVYQFGIGSTASAGATAANTFSFRYDET